MKLGSETGSFVNHMLSGTEAMPVVGQGATILMWSDRHAYEVVSVSNDGRRAIIERCKTRIISGSEMDGSAKYDLSETEGVKTELRYRYGGWYIVGYDVIVTDWDKFDSLSPSERLDERSGKWAIISGVTEKKTVFSKVSIAWGRKDEYRDPTF